MERGAHNVNDGLDAAEAALKSGAEENRTDCTSLAKQYASAVMHEAINPLEAINNLVYIVKQTPQNSEVTAIYLDMVEAQLKCLTEVARRTLLFCKE